MLFLCAGYSYIYSSIAGVCWQLFYIHRISCEQPKDAKTEIVQPIRDRLRTKFQWWRQLTLPTKQLTFIITNLFTLHYILEYVAFTEIGVESYEDLPELPKDVAFLKLVSRGKLSHPLSDLFDLSQYYYSFLKLWNPKCSSKVFFEAYDEICCSTDYVFDNISSVNRRIFLLFFKALVKK